MTTATGTTTATGRSVRRWLRAYRVYLRAAVAVSLEYRGALYAFLGVTLLWIVALTRVWTAVYHGRSTVAGYPLHTMVVYLTLANLQGMLLQSPLSFLVANRIRSGEVVFDVSRPIGYPGQMLALRAGQSLAQIGLAVLVTPLAAVLGGLSPAGTAAALGYLLALILGWLLNAMLALLMGLSAFWTVDNLGLTTLFRFIAAFFAGASMPLAFLPGPLRALAEALPFRFIVYQPAAVYVGRVHGGEVTRGLGLAVLWTVLLAGLTALVWRRAFRRIVVHGG